MSLVRGCLWVNAVVYMLSGAVMVARPQLVWDSYSDFEVTKLVEVMGRLLGGILVCCGGLCVGAASRLSTPLLAQAAVFFSSGVALIWTLVHGVEGLSSKGVDDTYAGLQGGIGGVLLLTNSIVMMLHIFSRIPPTPTSPPPDISLSFSTHNPESETAPLLDQPKVFSINDEERDEGAKADPKKRGWAKLLSLAKPEQRILYAGCLALLIRLPFSLSIPHFVSETISCLINNDESGAIKNIIFLVAAGTVDAVLDFWNFFLFGFAQQRLIKRLRCNLFKRLLSQEVAFYDATSTGDVISRLQVDTAEMGNDLTWVFRWTIEAVVRILGVIGYMFVREWRLALVTVAVIPVCAVVNKVYGDWLSKNAEKVQTALAESNEVAQEVISAVRTVYSFNNQRHESGRYEAAVSTWYNLNIKQTFMQALYYMVVATFLVNTCVQAAILLYGTKLVIHDGMDASVLFAFMLYQAMLQQWVSQLLNSFTNLIKSTGAGVKVFELLEREIPQYTSSDPKQPTPGDTGHCIELSDVHFKYPTRPAEVLKGISLKVEPGQTVALVGLSGAGKSTVFHLLEKFYVPTGGGITVNGTALCDVDPGWLHSKVALVGQEPVLFAGTIRSNILYSILDANPELEGRMAEDAVLADTIETRLVEAVEKANAAEFVAQLPKKFDTEVGEKGVQLSGGQKQRIAIARALMQDPGILLLDEATSALDASSERVVQRALEAASQGRTTLVIAHRLSTVARADTIIVLDNGAVVQQGTHQELLALPAPPGGGLTYRKLVEQQMKPDTD